MQGTFKENPQIKINSLKKIKHRILINSDKAFKGIVLDRALLSLMGNHLKLRALIIPLRFLKHT